MPFSVQGSGFWVQRFSLRWAVQPLIHGRRTQANRVKQLDEYSNQFETVVIFERWTPCPDLACQSRVMKSQAQVIWKQFYSHITSRSPRPLPARKAPSRLPARSGTILRLGEKRPPREAFHPPNPSWTLSSYNEPPWPPPNFCSQFRCPE